MKIVDQNLQELNEMPARILIKAKEMRLAHLAVVRDIWKLGSMSDVAYNFYEKRCAQEIAVLELAIDKLLAAEEVQEDLLHAI